jgi:serine/threonine protein kinase/tetratricopeptide (TPR) repeat protein
VRLSRGAKVGPYEVLAPLGAGGMGEVYRARDPKLDRDVALKVLPEATARDAHALARFAREAKAVAALSHPNILAIHDLVLENDPPFAVMELLEGENLASRISNGPISWREALRIAVAIAEGLAAAHAKGIVHRDLKPANVFLGPDGHVKILDFGLARVQAGSADTSGPTASRTEPGTVLGTVGYMSPEQVRGLTAEPTSDIFSFGCILFEMITGAHPFRSGTAPETLAAVLRDPAPRLESRAGVDSPPELARVVDRCLAKEPHARFQSALDLAFALRVLASEPRSEVRLAARPVRRLRLLASGGLLVLLSAAVVGWLAWRRGAPGAGLRSVAVLPLANLSGDPEQEYFADGMTDELITALSRVRDVRVISRTSVMRFKGTKEALPAIAKTLGVDTIVEGSVRHSGSRVVISAKLVRAASERSLWADSYERDMKDVFALQSDVARAIVGGIGARLTQGEQAQLAQKRAVDPAAYEAYLKANYYSRRLDSGDIEKSREYLEKAIRIAPDFAPAYTGLSFYYAAAGVEGSAAPKLVFPKAEAAAMKAFELDPSLPQAHEALAWVYLWYHWNLEAAERESQRGNVRTESEPSFNQLVARYRGNFATAIAEGRRRVADDPLGLGPRLKLGTDYAWARRYDEAIAVYREAIEVHPDSSQAHELLADAYAGKGKHEETVEELKKALELSQLDDWAEELGRDLASLGWERAQRNLTHKRLTELLEVAKEGTAYVPAYQVATLYVALGDKENAFLWLDKAVDERAPGLVALGADPQWDALRADPRFAALRRRIVPQA